MHRDPTMPLRPLGHQMDVPQCHGPHHQMVGLMRYGSDSLVWQWRGIKLWMEHGEGRDF